MGKKNFLENYDPLRAQLGRDALRVAPPAPSEKAAPLPPQRVATEERPLVENRPAPTVEPVATPAVHRQPIQPSSSSASLASRHMTARVKVDRLAFNDLEALLARLHRSTGSQFYTSVATRALWGLLVQAEAQVVAELQRTPLGTLPTNHDQVSYAEYEERLRHVLAAAFRHLPRTAFQAAPASAA